MQKSIKNTLPTKNPISFSQSIQLCKFQCIETGKMIIDTFTSFSKLKSIKSILSSTKDISKNLNSGSETILQLILFYFIMFSLSVGLFNLLPFFGLDGGWILISIINIFVKFSKNGERILIRTLNYGTILLFTFMFFLVFKDIWHMFLEFFA